MFFSSWDSVLRTLVVGFCAYAALILMLRVSGKRTLAKLNAFDLVVTVAMGSVLATTLVSRDVRLVDGVVAFLVLIVGQFLISWGGMRSARLRSMTTASPALLYYGGAYLETAMRRERISHEEVRAAIRNQGLPSVETAQAVVLETDGSLTVLGDVRDPSVLEGVRAADHLDIGRSAR